MSKLSVVISAYNEEKKLSACLNSVKELADEIVVINNSSTDKTESIAKKYTKQVFTRENNLMLNVNKNFGFEKATGDWILSLDADERITSELAQEIRKMIEEYHNYNGYWIPRKNIVFGKWIEHTGWYPDYQLRLFKKSKGKFAEAHVHEMVTIEGETAKLQNPMTHLNYETIQQFINKMNMIYTPNEAKNLQEKGYKVSYFDVITMPAKEFMNRFFAQQGYRDGFHGFALSLLQAFYYLLIVMNAWQEEGFPEIESKENYQHLGREVQKIKKEMKYWYFTSLLEMTRNPFQKISVKIKRKLTRS